MDALKLLRRSRAHKRHPSPDTPPIFDVQPIIAGIENASDIDPNYRRSHGEINKRMTPDELQQIQASMSQSVAKAVASASQARAAGVSIVSFGAGVRWSEIAFLVVFQAALSLRQEPLRPCKHSWVERARNTGWAFAVFGMAG